MKLAALLLELEGCVVETEDIHRRAFNVAFREFGQTWLWDEALYGELLTIEGGKERLKRYIERTAPSIKERSDYSNFVDAMHKAKNFAFRELVRSEGIALRRGVLPFLRQAQAEDIRLAITTSMTQENVTVVLQHGLQPHCSFDVIGWGERVAAKKPATDIYVWTLGELALPSAACFAMESTPHGVKGCLSAGIGVAVTVTRYSRQENFDGAQAVLDGWGDDKNPVEVIDGNAHGHPHVTLNLIRQWHEQASSSV